MINYTTPTISLTVEGHDITAHDVYVSLEQGATELVKTGAALTMTAVTVQQQTDTTIGTKNGATIATATWNVKLSSTGTATSRASTTPRGIYPYSCTVSTSNGVTSAAIVMYSCYNSTQTGTINGTYTARVYGVKLYDLIGG